MTRSAANLLTLIAFLSAPTLALAFGGGVSGLSTSGCGACHVDAGDGIEVLLDCPSAVAPGQTIQCDVSVNGSPTGGGGFNASATSGILSAGLNSQFLAGEVTQAGAAARNWTFSWQAPDMATDAMIRVAGMGANADGAISGDDWDLATMVITVTEGGDTDGDGTDDADDCAPTDPAIFPGAGEDCGNGIDDDCDGAIDDGDADCNPLLIVLGDVAPSGAPDGVVDVMDVILILRFAAGLDVPTAVELALADIAPGSVSEATLSPALFIPTPNGVIDVGDVVVVLRQSVALIRVICRPLPAALISTDSNDHVPTGSMVTLDSSGSSEVESRSWSLSTPAGSLATLSSATAVSPTFTPDVEGTYTATLTVGNCAGNSTDTLSRTASSVYSAGGASTANYDAIDSGIGQRNLANRRQYTTNVGSTDCRLSAGNSFGVGMTTYHWEQVGGPPVELSDPHAENPTFDAPTVADILDNRDGNGWGVAGLQYHELELIFELTVTAGGQSDVSEVDVFLEYGGYELPARGPFKNIARGSRTWLEGAAEEDDGDVITGWTWSIAGPAGDETPAIEGNGTRAPSFVPMVEGLYEVSYMVDSVDLSGAGAPDDSGSFLLTASNFAGSGQGDDQRPTCAHCHDGSVMPDIATDFWDSAHGGVEFAYQVSVPWFAGTSTASIAALDPSKNPPAYELNNASYCWRCHTGWNPAPLADNGGLDDVLVQTGFEIPPGGITWEEVLSEFPTVANLAGQQCESCHGPGAMHDGSLNANAIDPGSLDSMVCGQCHASQVQEWLTNSGHATPYLRDSTSCFPCHAGQAFVAQADGEPLTDKINAPLSNHSCAVCHDPHSAENPYQLRVFGEVTMLTGEVFDRGAGASCLTCHNGRYSDPDHEAVAHGAHGNSEGPVLLGVSYASHFRDGFELDPTEFSFHGRDEFVLGNFVDGGSDTNDACVTCHMAGGPPMSEQGFRKIGGHTHRTVSRDVVASLTDSDEDGEAALIGGSAVVEVAGADFLADFADLGEDSVLELIIEAADSALGEHRIVSFTNTTLTLEEPVQIGDDDDDPFVATEWRVEEVEAFDNVSSCAPCHSNLTDFNRMSRADYDGDGHVEGVQTEVRGLLDILGLMIVEIDKVDDLYPDGVTEERCDPDDDTGLTYPRPGRVPSPTDWVDGSTIGVSRRANFCLSSDDVLLAAYNWRMIFQDGSMGIHNTGFTVQLLQRSYTALRAVYPDVDDPRSSEDDASHTSFADAYPMATIR